MSTRVKTHIGEKICDGCGKSLELNLAAVPGSLEHETNGEILSDWYQAGRRIYLKARGEIVELHVDACCPGCLLLAATKKLVLPPELVEPEEESIDLNSLRAGSAGTN